MIGHFIKLPNSTLIPSSESDRELLTKIKTGETVRLTLTRPRNVWFHRKYFALLNLAFDCWEPPEHGNGSALTERMSVEKNFDRFRKDIAILAGFYDATYRLNGDVRLEGKSISFASMSEDHFEDLYSKSIDVILKHVMHNYTESDLRKTVEDMIMEFA